MREETLAKMDAANTLLDLSLSTKAIVMDPPKTELRVSLRTFLGDLANTCYSKKRWPKNKQKGLKAAISHQHEEKLNVPKIQIPHQFKKEVSVPKIQTSHQFKKEASILKYYQDKNSKKYFTLEWLQQEAKKYQYENDLAENLGMKLDALKKIFGAITYWARTHDIDFPCTFETLYTLSTEALQLQVGKLYQEPIPRIQRPLNQISLSEIHQTLCIVNTELPYTDYLYMVRAAAQLNIAGETLQAYIGGLALNIDREPHDLVNMTLEKLIKAIFEKYPSPSSPFNMAGAYVISAPPLTKESIIAAFQKNYPSLRQLANYGLGCAQNILKRHFVMYPETLAAVKDLLPTLKSRALQNSARTLFLSLPTHLNDEDEDKINSDDKMGAPLPTAEAPATERTQIPLTLRSPNETNPQYTPTVVQ